MTVTWSPHAQDLFGDILVTIAEELSPDDACRWQDKFDQTVSVLCDTPFIGRYVAPKCFANPDDAEAEHLHQLLCGPYRIIYEIGKDRVSILSVRHCRMLIREDDTKWQ